MSRLIKGFFVFTLIVAIQVSYLSPTASAVSSSEWKAGRIVDDNIFFSRAEFDPGQIQNFLNARVQTCDTNGTQLYSGSTTRAQYGTSRGYPPPYTCLKDYSMTISSVVADELCQGIPAGSYSAASIIFLVSNACGVSARALIVLLEKEQGLVTDDWPWSNQYRSATGYGCPDTAACDSKYYGFFNQVYNAAWQFKAYAKYPTSYRYKPYQNNTVLYNPNTACGSSSVYIENRATAGLYNYTPYQPNASALANLYGSGDSCGAYGNRNFWRLFNDWFGSTYSPNYMCMPLNNNSSLPDGKRLISMRYNNQDGIAFVMSNNTGSGCAEVHPLNSALNAWAAHIATTQPSFDPSEGMLISTNTGNSNSRIIYAKYKNTQNNMIEFHVWDNNLQGWVLHQVTDQPVSELSNGMLLGVGNSVVFVKYKNTYNNMIEMHGWNSQLTGWTYHTVSNQSASEMVNGTIIAKGDRLIFAKYGAGTTLNNMIEFHEWAPGFKDWTYHIVSNQPASEMANGKLLIRGDRMVFIKYKNTSFGKVEFHEWGPGYASWTSHIVSDMPESSEFGL